MASVSWTASGSGTWSQGANWSTGAAPMAGDDVTIDPTSSGNDTVTYGPGSTAALTLDSLNVLNAAFDFVSGTLAVANGYEFSGLSVGGGAITLGDASLGYITGSVSLTGGATRLIGNAELTQGSATQTAGTLQIDHGTLTDLDSTSNFSGTIQGNGGLVLESANVSLLSGFGLKVASTTIATGNVSLNESLSYANDFTLAQAGTLNVLGSTGGKANALTLSGLSSLNGVIANSVIDLTGRGHFNGLQLENGSLLNLTGTYSQLGLINLGLSGTGTLDVGSTGVLRLTGNNIIYNSSQGGTLINSGTIVKTGGNPVNGQENIYATVVNTGVINVGLGTVAFWAPSNGATSTLGGTITGAGTAAFETGNYAISNTGSTSSLTLTTERVLLTDSATITITTVGSLTYAGQFDQTGGTLVVGSPGQAGGNLDLTGIDALDGGLMKGTGTVLCSGPLNLGGAMQLEGNLTFHFGTGSSFGTVSQTGLIYLGSETDAITSAVVSPGETWLMKGGATIYGSNGTITNAGLFEKISGAGGGSGTSTIQNSFVNLSGATLAVDSGVLTLSGGGSLGGTVTGTNSLDISGNVTFATGLALTVAETILDNGQITLQSPTSGTSNLTYSNDWSQAGGTLALNGQTLTLDGITSFEFGAIQGSGTVVVNGALTLNQDPEAGTPIGLQQGSVLVVNSTAEQGGTLSMSGGSVAPTLSIGTHGVYTLDSGACIGTPLSSVTGSVIVGGTLVAANPGTSTLTANVVDNGMIKVADSELNFIGPLSGTGKIAISEGGIVDLTGGGSNTGGITFGAGGGTLELLQPGSFHETIFGFASGDTIELGGFSFLGDPKISDPTGGKTVTISENGNSITLTFATSQTASLLVLGEGDHGVLSLYHI